MTIHTDTSIDAYLIEFERGLVDYMEDMSGRPAYKWFLNGRNAPKIKAGDCEPPDERRQTWSPTWYGAMAATDDLAERWGSEALIRWHDANLAALIRIVPKWISVFGIPPGEDCLIPGLCGVSWSLLMSDVRKYRGDTDPKRHIDFYGQLRRLARDDVRNRLRGLGITDQMIADFLGALRSWVAGSIQHFAVHPREHLRVGNVLSTACGLVLVADAMQEDTLRFEAQYAIRWFLFTYYGDEDRQTIQGADGSWWHDYNYGEMEFMNGRYQPPFAYGWYPNGMQAWYRGHITTAMIRVAGVALKFEMTDVLNKAAEVFLVQTRWADATERKDAPFADFTADGSIWFHNSIVGGGKFTSNANDRFLLAGENDNWQELMNVQEGEQFLRFAFSCSGVGVWTMDPQGYWAKTYKDPGGGEHVRLHDSGSGRKFTPRLPSFETSNGYECCDGQAWRAALFSDDERKTYARFLAFHHLGWPHISSPVVKLGTELFGPVEGANLVGKPSRPTAWLSECASDLRASIVGAQGGETKYPTIFDALWGADTAHVVERDQWTREDDSLPPVAFKLEEDDSDEVLGA